MSAACLLVGATALSLASGGFDLSWTHSVEKTGWREHWVVEGRALRLTEAAVKGSGAGMEPGPEARLEDGWWVWTPEMPAVPELVLASSGATVSAWRLCHDAECMELGAMAQEPIRIKPCQGL